MTHGSTQAGTHGANRGAARGAQDAARDRATIPGQPASLGELPGDLGPGDDDLGDDGPGDDGTGGDGFFEVDPDAPTDRWCVLDLAVPSFRRGSEPGSTMGLDEADPAFDPLADIEDVHVRIREPLADQLRDAGPRRADMWLCCLHCERFFQARHLRSNGFGDRQGCPFCPSAGFDVSILPWNAFGGDDWPGEHDLHHGKLMP